MRGGKIDRSERQRDRLVLDRNLGFAETRHGGNGVMVVPSVGQGGTCHTKEQKHRKERTIHSSSFSGHRTEHLYMNGDRGDSAGILTDSLAAE